MATYEETVDHFKNTSDEQRDVLAGIYGEIVEDIGPAVEKARYAAEKLSPTVRGVTELNQLINIMDGGFVRIAAEIITEAQNAATTPGEEPNTEA